MAMTEFRPGNVKPRRRCKRATIRRRLPSPIARQQRVVDDDDLSDAILLVALIAAQPEELVARGIDRDDHLVLNAAAVGEAVGREPPEDDPFDHLSRPVIRAEGLAVV